MTQDKDQILTELTGIINESFEAKKPYSGPQLGLRRFINDMIAESNSNPEVMKSLETIDNSLNEGVSESQLAAPLLEMIKTFSRYIPELRKVQEKLQNTINENAHQILMTCLLEGIQNTSVLEYVKPKWEALMETNSMSDRLALERVLESCAGIDPSAAEMLKYVSKFKQESVGQASTNSLNESSVEMNQEEKTKADLLSKMKEYVDNKLAESSAPAKKSFKDIDNDIRLMETIQDLKSIDNKDLQKVLSLYEKALNDGCREEAIYETFMMNVFENEKYNYYMELAKAQSDMAARVMSHKESIDLTKLLEFMSNDGTWSYLVPVVEDVVVAYAENPNAINRSILNNHLRMYDSCPYVRDILEVAWQDTSKEGTMLQEAEQELIKQRAHVEDVFSPIQYIKENECVFSVEGQLYVKKGHNISRLDKKSVGTLSESFLALAKIIDMPSVSVNEAEDCIDFVAESGSVIKIQDGKALVEGKLETPTSLKSLVEMHVEHPTMTDIDFLTSAFLSENFNNIAKVDFVKKVVMNESSNKTLDVFKVKKNLYVAAHDNLNEEHTFYRNINPMQVKTIVNDHFGINVSSLFEDMLPNQKKLSDGINDIKKEYEEKIQSLLEMKQRLSDTYQKTGSADTKNKLEQALTDITREINEAKSEYVKFQKKASLVETADPDETIDNVLDSAEAGLNDTMPDDFSDTISLNTEDYDGSDEDLDTGSDDFSGSDSAFEDLDGSDDFDELNFDLEDGSDFGDEDEYTSSDGDDMTSRIGENEFSTNPDDIDDSDELMQRDNYVLDDKLDYTDTELDAENAENSAVDAAEDDNSDAGIESFDNGDLTPDAEDDPFAADTEALGETPEDGDTVSDLDNEAEGDNVAGNDTTEEVADDADLDYASFKIVKIDFDVNVRTGERKNTGKAIVVVPMVDGAGNKTSETKNIDFYVTEIKGEKGVVLDSEGITLEMYNAVCDAIKSSSDFQDVEPEVNPADNDETSATDITSVEVKDEEDPEDAIDLSDVDDPDSDPTDGDGTAEDVFDSGSDETTVLTMDDNIEPHGVDVQELSDTDQETAESGEEVEDEYKGLFDDPEDQKVAEQPMPDAVDAVPESKKSPKGNKLNESTEDETEPAVEEDPDGVVRGDLDISSEQEDPIAVIKEVLEAYAENGGDCEVGEINDYDVDGVDVNSIQATIGSNDYTFFTLYEDIFCALTSDFDEYSQDKDSLEAWCTLEESDSDEAPLSANVEIAEGDTQAWIDFVTDVIATETGDKVEFEAEEPEEDEQVVEEPVTEGARVRVNPKKN